MSYFYIQSYIPITGLPRTPARLWLSETPSQTGRERYPSAAGAKFQEVPPKVSCGQQISTTFGASHSLEKLFTYSQLVFFILIFNIIKKIRKKYSGKLGYQLKKTLNNIFL